MVEENLSFSWDSERGIELGWPKFFTVDEISEYLDSIKIALFWCLTENDSSFPANDDGGNTGWIKGAVENSAQKQILENIQIDIAKYKTTFGK